MVIILSHRCLVIGRSKRYAIRCESKTCIQLFRKDDQVARLASCVRVSLSFRDGSDSLFVPHEVGMVEKASFML